VEIGQVRDPQTLQLFREPRQRDAHLAQPDPPGLEVAPGEAQPGDGYSRF
jgi:hypothetical protein